MRDSGIRYQSFAAYLVNHAPAAVEAKLEALGRGGLPVNFMRALGLNTMLAAPPARPYSGRRIRPQLLSLRRPDLPQSRQGQATFTGIETLDFDFEIFASGEYSRMLEREWAES